MKNILNEGNQIHNFISSSGSGTSINYGSGSDFSTSYGSGSGSTSQKVTVPRFRFMFHNAALLRGSDLGGRGILGSSWRSRNRRAGSSAGKRSKKVVTCSARLPGCTTATSPGRYASSPGRAATSPGRVATSPGRAASSPGRAGTPRSRATRRTSWKWEGGVRRSQLTSGASRGGGLPVDL